eukprot:CAMPEP_0184404160 /NCGR_PEP_ID=MMETSP0007-20130409/85793_1 /TAXON_ID=97485 /ORGANISM="Prymnesium parvum, Strain Texoma1" /LENGTH=44 /DNA_ID= /DNA_START= /DNA_END= /DNA_ORIENTATION=
MISILVILAELARMPDQPIGTMSRPKLAQLAVWLGIGWPPFSAI